MICLIRWIKCYVDLLYWFLVKISAIHQAYILTFIESKSKEYVLLNKHYSYSSRS